MNLCVPNVVLSMLVFVYKMIGSRIWNGASNPRIVYTQNYIYVFVDVNGCLFVCLLRVPLDSPFSILMETSPSALKGCKS